MSIVAEFSIPPNAVPGGQVLTEIPDAIIKLERIVPTSEGVLPFFWVFGADTGAVVDCLQAEPDIARVAVLAEVDDQALCQAAWTPDAEIIEGIKTLRATILEARGTDNGWLFQVRAESRERLSNFQQLFTEQGIPVEVCRIFNFAELVKTSRPLTPGQRELLVTAYEAGYFDQPRQVTQEDLGEQFGITGRAVSNRLRRGMRNLITATLLDPADRDPTDARL